MNLSELINYTRDLSGIYATDVVSDTLVKRWLNESYFEIARRASWPWTATALETPTDEPAFDAQFHAMLPYRAAIRVLNFVSDDTKRSELYAQEFTLLLADLDKFYLPAAATGASNNVAAMTRAVRDLTSMYSAQALPDSLILVYLNQAYNELARRHDWDWLEATYDVALPPADDDMHSLTLPNGTRRVMEAYLLYDSGEVREMVNAPNLARIEVNEAGVFYDIDFSGNVTIRPEQDGVDLVKFRYMRRNVSLVTPTDVPSFDESFRMILPYRAAITVLSQMAPGDPRIAAYETEFTSLYEGMYTMYELVHDNRTFQLGEEGVQTRRYYPWFRPA